MTELKPCPFCGGEAKILRDIHGVVSCSCGAVVTAKHKNDTAEAIAAWNSRAERTCKWELEHSGTLYDKWRCSKCGYLHVESRTDGGATDFDPNFCPNCGSKVVGE